jgi:hypothetical protein
MSCLVINVVSVRNSIIHRPSSAGGKPGENIGKRWHRDSLCSFLDREPLKPASLQLRHKRWLVIPGDNSVDRMVGERVVGEVLIGTARKMKKGSRSFAADADQDWAAALFRESARTGSK